MNLLYVVFVVIGLLLIIILMFNRLIGKKNQVENAFSSIDVMLKKRSELIPQIVATVKGYALHERELFERITQLRSQAQNTTLDSNSRVQVENEITLRIAKIMIVAEAYPDLKASENFLHLQRSIAEMEEQLSATRRAFNASINNYNDSVQKFPSNILAGMMGFKRKAYFELSPISKRGMEETPQIKI